MSDIPDFSAPAPVPTDRGRPNVVVQRDLAVARLLHEEPRPLQQVADVLAAGNWRTAYNSVCRLRERGLAELSRNGTRTPVWQLTERGTAWLADPEPAPPQPSGEQPPPPQPAEVQPAGFSTVY